LKNADIRAVRGPKTAEALGLPKNIAMTDPAVLIARMEEFSAISTQYNCSFVPHWESHICGIWPEICARLNIHYINPCDDSKEVIKAIAASTYILAESMHAAILADAFGIPWIAVSSSDNINSFKWQDWLDGLDMEYSPCSLLPSTRWEAKYKGGRYAFINYRAGMAGLPDPQSHVANSLHNKPAHKKVVESALAKPALKSLLEASRKDPDLSDRSVLNARIEQLETMLESVRADYLL
jgi:succinoglycan biosynthesis protein ExoV